MKEEEQEEKKEKTRKKERKKESEQMSTISKHTPAISLQTNRNPNQADNKPGIRPIKQSENKTYNAQRVFSRTVLFRIFHTRTYARERTLNCNACFWDQVAEEIGIRSLRPNQITRRDVS